LWLELPAVCRAAPLGTALARLGAGWVRPKAGSACEIAMNELWIVHRDASVRAALGRLAAGDRPAREGSPLDEAFDRAPPAEVVVLGVAGDLEPELEFARRQLARPGDTAWIVVHEAERPPEELARLFAGLGARWLAYPADAKTLQHEIARAAAAGAGPTTLPARRLRHELEARARRYTADLALPMLERAPWLERVWIRGEPGTGRLLLARALHARGPGARAPLVHVPCDPAMKPVDLAGWLALANEGVPDLTVCLEDVDLLAAPVQRWLRGIAEAGAADERFVTRRLRWLVLMREGPRAGRLDPALAEALAGLELQLPPLRARPTAIAAFAASAARAWAEAAGAAPAVFGADAIEALEAHPWPGNLRELEAVVVRTLAAGAPDPIPAAALRFETAGARAARPVPALSVAPAPEALAARRTDAMDGRGEPSAGAAEGPPPERAPGRAPELVRRLARSLAHELRNPLVAIRTFAALLPERSDDPEFRDHFREQVEEELARVEATLEQVSRFAEADAPNLAPVDVTALLESLLEERREEIQARRLLVLQELDVTRPQALADEALLRFALQALLSRALSWIPERADLFVASRYHPRGLDGGPSVRVLLRFYDPRGPRRPQAPIEPEAAEHLSLRATALELVLAEQLVEAQGGRLRVDASEADETLVVLDLPARAEQGAPGAEPGGAAHPRP
jgi:DNA-binding NtrC family response regulator